MADLQSSGKPAGSPIKHTLQLDIYFTLGNVLTQREDNSIKILKFCNLSSRFKGVSVLWLKADGHEPYRPSHTTHPTAKNAVIFLTYYQQLFFHNLQRFFQQRYIWATIFKTFFQKNLCSSVCSLIIFVAIAVYYSLYLDWNVTVNMQV